MGDTATGDYNSQVPIRLISHDNSHDSNTSYYYRGKAPVEVDNEERKKIPVVLKYEDDDGLGGFGLLEPKDNSKPVKKNDPKTRWKRPQEEWTPADIAAEFAFQVGKKIPWAPGIVNQGSLRGALAKQRKDYGITAPIELEILQMFLVDEESFRDVGDKVPHLYKKYLSMFRTHLNKAYERLGLQKPGVVSEPPPQALERKVLIASDGTQFDDTIAGRAFFKKHEETLTRKEQ
jgi:hypothetical protein